MNDYEKEALQEEIDQLRRSMINERIWRKSAEQVSLNATKVTEQLRAEHVQAIKTIQSLTEAIGKLTARAAVQPTAKPVVEHKLMLLRVDDLKLRDDAAVIVADLVNDGWHIAYEANETMEGLSLWHYLRLERFRREDPPQPALRAAVAVPVDAPEATDAGAAPSTFEDFMNLPLVAETAFDHAMNAAPGVRIWNDDLPDDDDWDEGDHNWALPEPEIDPLATKPLIPVIEPENVPFSSPEAAPRRQMVLGVHPMPSIDLSAFPHAQALQAGGLDAFLNMLDANAKAMGRKSYMRHRDTHVATFNRIPGDASTAQPLPVYTPLLSETA